MRPQNLIKENLSKPESIEYIRQLLAADANLTRRELSRQLCRRFKFFDAAGNEQLGTTAAALSSLEGNSTFVLPKGAATKRCLSPARLEGGLRRIESPPGDVAEIGNLKLALVRTKGQMRIWNEMMIEDHPNGYGPLVGRQIRYLIESEYGLLGGFGFSSSALALRDRDRWMMWSDGKRKAHLDLIAGMSRFLIREEVRCRNLASKTLSMAAKALPEDFRNRYGFVPLLLESFVDASRFEGTVYRAANWIRVGRTQGRGRQDRHHRAGKGAKDIYMLPLDQSFRRRLGLPDPEGPPTLELAEGLAGDQWACNEFETSSLGDKRLNARLADIARRKALAPGKSWLEIAQGDKASTKAYYRFVSCGEDSAISFEKILEGHRDRTVARMRGHDIVLAIQDTSDLNFNSLNACKGLGINGKNSKASEGSKGLKLHSTFVVNERGLPLGVLRSDCYARKSAAGRDAALRETPIEEKESYRWVEGLMDCAEVSKTLKATKIVCVADREGDVYDIYDYARSHPEIELLIRVTHERKCKRRGYPGLFDQLRSSAKKAEFELDIPGKSARSSKSNQKARKAEAPRKAKMQLRYQAVDIPPPDTTLHRGKAPIPMRMVHIAEVDAPAGVAPIEWFLATTVPVLDVETALTCVKWYRLRWRIEEWHRVLKSGCNIEKAKNRTAENIKRAIAVDLVVAWRIMLMRLLGRESPELPADNIFSEMELNVLNAYALKKTA